MLRRTFIPFIPFIPFLPEPPLTSHALLYPNVMDLLIVAKLVFVTRDGSLDVQVATRLGVYLSMLSEKME